MDIAIQQPAYHNSALSENTLIWAIICSLLLHILIVFIVPNIKFEAAKKPEVLNIELAPPAQPKPAPMPIVEPIKPAEPVKPKPIEKTPVKPLPKPITQASPVVEPPTHEPLHENPPPVITASPKAEAIPTFTAPAPTIELPKSAGPTEADLSAARGQYADTLRREVAKDKKYPNIAASRGYQGDVVLNVKLDSNGNVLSATVHTSSSFESLDKEAIAKILRISPFPLPPEALRGRTFNVTVPISFKLE